MGLRTLPAPPSAKKTMTLEDHRNIRMALTGIGPISVGPWLWGYLSLCIERKLTETEQKEICIKYFGWTL